MKWIIYSIMPALGLLERKMRAKDPDFVGIDDIVADQIKALIESLNKYLAEQEL